MDFDKVVKSRYSVRKYSDKKVDPETVKRIAECGNLAPTAKNTNCVRIYAVTDEAMLEKMKEVSPCIYGAPLIFVMCSDESLSWKNDRGLSRGEMDAAIAADHIMLSATNEGLGSCWVCLFDKDKMQKVLDMPENTVPHCIIICGYAADDAEPSERHFIRPDRVTYVG